MGYADGEHDSSAAGSLIDQYEYLVTSVYVSSSQVHSFLHRLSWHSTTVILMIMRPETFACLTALFTLFCLCHTFDFWSPVLAASVPRVPWLKFLASAIRRSAGPADGDDDDDGTGSKSSFFTSGLQDSSELRDGNVGVYAIRGRREKMEDMFDYVDERSRLGVQLFGVFDGHGSDVSPFF